MITRMLVIAAASFTATAAFASGPTPIATCWSQESGVGLCVKMAESKESNWKSLQILWTERDAGCDFGMNDRVKVREFPNAEIKRDNADGIYARQNHVFLWFGQKTKFTLDRKNGTALIRGKNLNCLDVGDGCRNNPEPSGRYQIRFDRCQFL